MKQHCCVLSKLDQISSNWYEVWAIFSMSLASMTEGSIVSWTSPSIPKLLEDDNDGDITMEHASYLVIIPCLTLFIASPIMAYLMNTIGRKPSLMLIFIPHFTSWLIIICTTNIYILYLARFINGFGSAIVFIVLPSYMSEISSPNIRGTWGNLPTIAIYLGQLLINIVGGYLSIPITACIFIVFPVIFLLTFYTLPESPYYLIMENRIDKARASLQKLRRCDNVEDELNRLINDVKRQTSETSNWSDLMTNKTHRRALGAGMFIRGIQQFSGLLAFNVYTVYLFQQAGLDISPTLAAIIYSTVLVITNAIASYTLDMLGRKLAMIISSGSCAFVHLLLFLFFLVKDVIGVDTSGFSWFPLCGLMLYVSFSAIGLGIVPTLIIGELFSASIKAKGVCILNVAFATFVLVSTKSFQLLTDNFGLYASFLLYFVCTFLGTIASFYVVPETKGKTLEEIQQSMKK